MPKKNFKYYDVYGKIKEDLIAGKYPSGSMLPTEDELVELYQASKTTIRHATKLLESEHFIERQQGRGTVILEFQQYRSRHKYHGDTVKVKYRTNGPGIPSRREDAASGRGACLPDSMASADRRESLWNQCKLLSCRNDARTGKAEIPTII